MKTFLLQKFGLQNLVAIDRELPQPAAGEVVVRLRAVSLNYRDLMIVQGSYNPKMRLPVVPLSDGAGEIVTVGAGVTQWKAGDRVCPTFFQRWLEGGITIAKRRSTLGGDLDGVMREYAALGENGVVAIPAHLSYEEAATLPCAGLTAWHALVVSGGLRAGETVLTLGTGGVSMAALQIARAAGARVIATSSSDEKLERARQLGAAATINYRRTPEWDAEVMRLTDGAGVDHVIEVGGAGTLPKSIACLRPAGHIALIGFLAGGGAFDPGTIIGKGARLHGIYVGSREMFRAMNRALEAGAVHPAIDRTFAIEDFAAAFERLEKGAHFGKIVLTFAG